MRETIKQRSKTMETAKRQCYYINPCQDSDEHGGFVPSLVTENEPGHSPLLGRGECSAPWVWGKTLEDAKRVCDEMNRKRNLDSETVNKIICSSMFPKSH